MPPCGTGPAGGALRGSVLRGGFVRAEKNGRDASFC